MNSSILEKIQVNIPFTMLYESYLSRVIRSGINPEIGFDAIALERFSFSDFAGIAKQIQESGLSVTMHAPFIDLSPGSPDPDIRALTRHRFEQILEIASLFKPKTIVCHTGYDDKVYWSLKDAWIQHSIELWSWFSEKVGKEGSALMLENVYERDPYEFLELFKEIRDRGVGFCLDTGHQEAFSSEGLSKWLEILGQYIDQVHLHDNHGIRDEHLALGKGRVDFQMLFRYLKDTKTEQPIITIEPHREEDFLPSLEYLESIWPW